MRDLYRSGEVEDWVVLLLRLGAVPAKGFDRDWRVRAAFQLLHGCRLRSSAVADGADWTRGAVDAAGDDQVVGTDCELKPGHMDLDDVLGAECRPDMWNMDCGSGSLDFDTGLALGPSGWPRPATDCRLVDGKPSLLECLRRRSSV